MKENAENEKQLENENAGWKAFMELRRQALHNMQQLSTDAEKAGSAGMTLDEINAEIAAARSGMEPVAICDHLEAIMNKENHLVEYKRELSETFERSVIAF